MELQDISEQNNVFDQKIVKALIYNYTNVHRVVTARQKLIPLPPGP